MRDHQLFSNKITASQAVSVQQKYKKFALISFVTFSMLFFAVIHFADAAEVNPYTKNYKEQNTNNLKSLNPKPDTLTHPKPPKPEFKTLNPTAAPTYTLQQPFALHPTP